MGMKAAGSSAGNGMAAKKKAKKTGAMLGFEDKLWAAADKLRGNMDAAEYKHVVLGLILLKYISDAFMEKWNDLLEAPRTNEVWTLVE